jgi:MoaA/NifB/PqqE/SkfB family radical SAM enzyme
MGFKPEEILFSPTTQCNLNCPHCSVEKSKDILSKRAAIQFLKECSRHGIAKVGFTGGEPFLVLDFLCAISRAAVKENMVFDRIMTNGVWFKNKDGLDKALNRLYKSGYDGSICVSVDAFHRQNLRKVALFVKKASFFWDVYIASVTGAREKETNIKLQKLSKLAGEKLKIFKIDLSPINKENTLKNPWDGKWFREDYCKGPGNVFYVMPDGDVKPCCGYATDMPQLTVGNIKRDSVKKILGNICNNKFICSVFGIGLSKMRKSLELDGFRFPGKTSNNCYFCYYILKYVPKNLLKKYL